MKDNEFISKIKRMKKKLDDKINNETHMGFFNSDEIEEMEAFEKKYPNCIIFYGEDLLED